MLSTVYSEINRLRTTGRLAAAVTLLKSQPPSSDEDAFEGVVNLFIDGDIDSAVFVCQSHNWTLPWARRMAAALVHWLAENNREAALEQARGAIADPDFSPDAEAFFLLILQAGDRKEEAYAYVGRLQMPPIGETFLLTVMAEVCVAAKDWMRAYQLGCAVLATDGENYRALMVLSEANFEFMNYHESLGNALCANQIGRGSLPATLQIMRCQNRLGDHYAAVAAFDALNDPAPVPPELHIELGVAYSGLERPAPAIAAYERALDADPPPMPAIRALLKLLIDAGDSDKLHAYVQRFSRVMAADIDCILLQGLEHLRRGRVDAAAQHLRRCHELNVQRNDAYGHLPWPVPEPRIRHDYEQLELLYRRGRLPAGGMQALQILQPYYAQTGNPAQTFAPEEPAATALRRALCDIHYCPDTPFAGAALGDNDYVALEARYAADKLVVIDGFLSPEALAELRRFSEEATVWKMYNPGGYTGALLVQGFAPRVLLAIADELRRRMPQVIQDHALLQAWGFKYDQRMRGITMHADFAKVNVNFWVTPDAACADPTTGGMVIYNHPVPRNWTFADYNSNPEKLQAYLKVHEAKPQRVPFRENRCVMFDSSLIHVTDELHFKPGYDNRRINVTLLFGRARSNE